MSLNPNAVIFWATCAIIGYFIDGKTIDGALIGAAVGFSLSILVGMRR